MGTTLWVISILSIISLTGGHSTLIKEQQHLAVYLKPLPEDIRPKVRLALRAEAGQPPILKECQHEQDSVPCPPNKFRTPSGECNNVRHPTWGTRGSPFLRLLDPEYADGKFFLLQNVVMMLLRRFCSGCKKNFCFLMLLHFIITHYYSSN